MHFRSQISPNAVTQECHYGRSSISGRKILVVDTPGVFSSSNENEKVIHEMKKCFWITSPGVHAVVFVTQPARITPEERSTLDFITKHFGDNILKHVIMLFTRCDDFRNSGQTLHDYVASLQDDELLKTMLDKCEKRFIGFNNNAIDLEREQQVTQLLMMIEQMVKGNGGNFFSNSKYIEVESYIRERMKRAKRAEMRGKRHQLAQMASLIKSIVDEKKMDEQEEETLQEAYEEAQRMHFQLYNVLQKKTENEKRLQEEMKQTKKELKQARHQNEKHVSELKEAKNSKQRAKSDMRNMKMTIKEQTNTITKLTSENELLKRGKYYHAAQHEYESLSSETFDRAGFEQHCEDQIVPQSVLDSEHQSGGFDIEETTQRLHDQLCEARNEEVQNTITPTSDQSVPA